MLKGAGSRSPIPFDSQRRAALSAVAATVGVAALPAWAAGKTPEEMAANKAAADGPVLGTWTHAYAAFGKPKYPRDFRQFEYVNPAAPKGGTLYLKNPDRRTAFDKMNPFTVTGAAPSGVELFMFETLATLGADEPMTMYGLLAEAMLIAPDKSAITFRLNPKATFSNGDPVTSLDVVHSFDTLTGKYAQPVLQTDYGSGVKRAVIVDERTIRFELSVKSSDPMFKLARLYVFSRKWGLKADGSHPRFDELITEIPLATGAYTVASQDSGRRIEFKRNLAYWARDQPVRRGFYNFDRIVYRYYKDDVVATEAFKAGEFDMVRVLSAPIWARQHRGAKWDDGRIVKKSFETFNGQGLQSYQLNLRRSIFKDVRVREAIALTFDFETSNRYRRFVRANSVFNNSEFAAVDLPSPAELELLGPFRAELPEQVFGPAYRAPRNDIDVNALRRNLIRARTLLEQAGWKVAVDGVLRNAEGTPFVFEYLSATGQDSDARMNPWRRNLAKLGIRMPDRKVDYALFGRTLETFDFDMVTIVEPDFTLPQVPDYVDLYGSKAAGENGSGNYRGVKSRAADHVLAAMGTAATLDAFRDACRAFDRIVMWNFWQVPELYASFENMSYWNKFGIPAVQPKYFQLDYSPLLTPLLAWPLTTWWIKDTVRR